MICKDGDAKKYRVNEIFYSVQAEGRNAGRPAVFVRFSGCNLSCPFCDTNHEPFREMTREEIEKEVEELCSTADTTDVMVVFTGGEPTLQLSEDEPLCKGRFLAMETNGILPPPRWVDWVTISPTTRLPVETLLKAGELKFVYGTFPDEYLSEVERVTRGYPLLYVQPMADENGEFDPLPSIDFIKRHPAFSLSLQWHKIFNIR